MTAHEVERLYTETAAAELVNIKPRSLRTERVAGRIGYKRVAGKIMYRRSDLIEWQNQGENPCRDQAADRGSPWSRSGDGPVPSITSDGPKMGAHASVRRAQAASKALRSAR